MTCAFSHQKTYKPLTTDVTSASSTEVTAQSIPLEAPSDEPLPPQMQHKDVERMLILDRKKTCDFRFLAPNFFKLKKDWDV